MRSRLPIVAVVAVVAGCCAMIAAPAPVPQAAQGAAVVLHFPHTFDTTGLDINYFASGHGGCGRFVRPEPGVWDYAIPSMCPLASGIGPAESVRAAIFAPGYSIALIDVPSLAALTTPDMDVRLNLLPLVTVTGRVVLLHVQRNRPAFVDVSYEASWHCEFYRLADCMLGIGHLALSTQVGPDGAFMVRIQDFAHDPALARFSSHGSFSFNLKDAAGDLVDPLGTSPGIPSQSSVTIDASRLSSPLVLYPYPRR